jgi:hypothetical protein
MVKLGRPTFPIRQWYNGLMVGMGAANDAVRILNLSSSGSTGGPSTPRLHGSIATVSGIPGHPVMGERKRCRPSDGYAGR